MCIEAEMFNIKTKDSFLNLIDEIRKALELDLYNCALALTLTLPDICGKVEYPNEKSKKRYINWLENYATSFFTEPTLLLPSEENIEYTWLLKEECYALRCAVLHSGNYELNEVGLIKVEIHVHKKDGENYSHIVKGEHYVDWDLIKLCETLCNAAEEYYLNSSDKNKFDVSEIRIDT